MGILGADAHTGVTHDPKGPSSLVNQRLSVGRTGDV